MKILITGSSGFIGYHLTNALTGAGHEVVGIDDQNDYYDQELKNLRLLNMQHQNFTFLKIDINDIHKVEGDFDILINLAAQAGVRVSKEREHLYKTTNIDGFKSVCNFCIKNNIKKIIYASSSSVYSDQNLGKFSESSDLKPKSLYGLSKLENENYAEYINKNFNVSLIGLRFFSVYGPFGRPDMAYYIFSDCIKNNKTVTLNNQGNMARDMTYIHDIVQGIMKAINYIGMNDKNFHEIFNLGNDNPIKTLDLLNMIKEEYAATPKIIKNTTDNESFFTHADITKAKKLLGYRPKTDIKEGIKMFLNWFNEYEKY